MPSDTQVDGDLDEVGQNLMRAASYIEEHGWCQGAPQDSLGRVCLIGALWKATPGEIRNITGGSLYNRSYFKVMEVIKEVPFAWNDRRERTKDEVVDLLKKAAYL